MTAVTRLHWMVYRWPLFLLLYAFSCSTLFFFLFTNKVVALAPLLLAVLAGFTAVYCLLLRYGSEYAVTNRRLIAIEGAMLTKTKTYALADVKSVNLKQDWLARLGGYGEIRLRFHGKPSRKLRSVEDAWNFYRKLYLGSKESAENSAAVTAPSMLAPSDPLEAEFARLFPNHEA